MKSKHIWCCIISIFVLNTGNCLLAQNTGLQSKAKNTSFTTKEVPPLVSNTKEDVLTNKKIKKNFTRRLRIGADIQQVITSLTNSRFNGFELMADYRIHPNKFIAVEYGKQNKQIVSTSIGTVTEGSYLKTGIDFNLYKQPKGLQHLIYTGLRYGISRYSQELNYSRLTTQTTIFGFEQGPSGIKSTGLTAHWFEFLTGIKVAFLKNFYAGVNVSLRYKITDQKPDLFDNLHLPGFGVTNDYSNFNVGFRYFISYSIPLYKK